MSNIIENIKMAERLGCITSELGPVPKESKTAMVKWSERLNCLVLELGHKSEKMSLILSEVLYK